MIQKVACISVNSYGGKEKRWFNYCIGQDQAISVGSVVRVSLRHKTSLGVVRQIMPIDKTMPAKLLAIEAVLDLSPLPATFIELIDWVAQYYCATDKAVWTTALPSGLRAKLRKRIVPPDNTPAVKLPFTLSNQQQLIFNEISNSSKKFFLLHGMTGSGKTEIYLSLIAETLKNGRSALLLVPEIVLTPQMIDRVERVFGPNVLCYHSKIRAAKRKAIWTEVLENQNPLIVVGTRSALFLPFHDLGIIILDEEHEPSYKQDSSPRYHAREVAAKMVRLHKAKLVMGSATPSVGSYYLAKLGKMELLSLAERYGTAKLPKTEIINLAKRSELLSAELSRAIRQTLARSQQVILFINRRGSATALLCTTCGKAITCPRCETSLTFHADLARLLCHYCGYKLAPPAICPNCSAATLSFIGSGTKKLETQIIDTFSNYKVARLDSDNATYDHMRDTLNRLKNRQLDILIGTQMISRGLDFAGIGLVGVVLADSVLNIADYSSSERTFELITQVSGRAGRNDDQSNAIIQTFSPEHYAITTAAAHDYEAFYERELVGRAKYVYPPFCYLLKLSYAHRDNAIAEQKSRFAATQISHDYPTVEVLGPVEAYIKRFGGKYHYNIVIKAKNRRRLTEIAAGLEEGWTIDLDPITLL